MINTTDLNSVYSSLANVFGVKSADIRYYIMKNKFNILKGYPEDVNIEEFLMFIKKLNGKATINFEKITISQLTSRIYKKDISKEPIFNLFDALTKETDMSVYLNEKGIEFKEIEGILEVYYKNQRVDWSKYFNGYESAAARMVSNRLEGNSFGSIDKCVNGFLFNGKLHENSDVYHIYKFPEILENMLRLLNLSNVSMNWAKISKSYTITFMADIENVVFDFSASLNNKQKQFKIIRYCLYYLSKKFFNDWDENCNPKMRLKDDLNVNAEQIINVMEI
ncbi:hypothetical protein ACTXGU_00225 [Niallia sp. 01092]|uniref:hypothetical protein n=1 Tax=Niallia sp. 01092 TaxID=3457759 RepID=UPI003FD58F49